MNQSIAAIDPIDATFVLGIMVLVAAVLLAIVGASADEANKENSKYLFGVVGVMLGLFGAGGLGTLFANQAADEAASSAAAKVAPKAANDAASQVSGKVSQQVEEELKAPSSAGGSGETGKKP
jgi:hypothetical protein